MVRGETPYWAASSADSPERGSARAISVSGESRRAAPRERALLVPFHRHLADHLGQQDTAKGVADLVQELARADQTVRLAGRRVRHLHECGEV
jgi:hypothetical protein